MVVIEFMEFGSLESYLEKHGATVTHPQRHAFIIDCVDGLVYLHANQFVHRDIAARNILLSSEKRCKIGDFGMSRDTHESRYYRSQGGMVPLRWAAPEALELGKYSEASDVWSFGILAYEIWTNAACPYGDWTNQQVWLQVSTGYRLPCPDTCPRPTYDLLMHACWAAAPTARPTFVQLQTTIGHLGADGDERVHQADAATSAPVSSAYETASSATSHAYWVRDEKSNPAYALTSPLTRTNSYSEASSAIQFARATLRRVPPSSLPSTYVHPFVPDQARPVSYETIDGFGASPLTEHPRVASSSSTSGPLPAARGYEAFVVPAQIPGSISETSAGGYLDTDTDADHPASHIAETQVDTKAAENGLQMISLGLRS